MGWLNAVMLILTVVERIIPVAERLVPTPGMGAQKAELVLNSAVAVGQTVLPGVNMQDPQIQTLLRAKLAADVALANALQTAAQAAGVPGGPAMPAPH